MRKTKHLIILSFILLAIPAFSETAFASEKYTAKVSLAIFPFNDLSTNSLDMDIPARLHRELSGHEFIEMVPVDVIREKVYEIEPSFLWTGKKGAEKRGGILWRIESEIIGKVRQRTSSRFSLYGDLSHTGDKSRLDVFILRADDPQPALSLTASVSSNEDVHDSITVMSGEIAAWLRGENRIYEAEEDVRQYMGGMQSYTAVLAKMKRHVDSLPESVPLRSLLLEFYLKEKSRRTEQVLHEGLKIVELLSRAKNEDVRYLLSLNLDPFDVVADIYEERKSWKEAIDVRSTALRSYPFNPGVHKAGLGRDHYSLARSLEKRGRKADALQSYRIAVTYLKTSSEYFQSAKEAIERLQ